MTHYLVPGIAHRQELRVDQTLSVPEVSKHFTGFLDMPPVFATAFMVGFIEWACVEALRDHLQPGQHSVGTHVIVSHVAATPVGMNVTAWVKLVEVKGKRLIFRVTCRDERDLIGEGFHERVIIDQSAFEARVAAKAALSKEPIALSA